MNISSDTKISALLKANPDSIEAIVSINKHFEKLRNPVLRKILASRVTIANASKIGGCTVDDFFKKLIPLGFSIVPESIQLKNKTMTVKERPAFMQKITTINTVTLDVREGLASGIDPFQKIMETISSLPPDNFLLIINTFEPVPLINVLKRKGFEYYTEELPNGLFHCYFKNTGGKKNDEINNVVSSPEGNEAFDKMLQTFTGKMKTIDVRHFEMPMPMVTILQELENLPKDHALFVQHKKIPQFLLPEIKEKNFSWLIREDGEGDVKMLIFR